MNILTWNGHNINDGTNYVAVLNADFYGLPGIQAVGGARTGAWPLLGSVNRPGREVHLEIFIRAGTSLQLMQWFDPEDEDPKVLVAEDNGGGNNRYVNAICTELREIPFSAGLHYGLTLFIVGDVRWRKVTADTDTWNISSDSDTNVLANGGEDDAYPILTITPTSTKTGGYAYKRFVVVNWKALTLGVTPVAGNNYPVDIGDDSFDTATLVSGGKMQADGDDLRVFVDGVEVDRWLDGINTSTTKVWINLDFQALIVQPLETALGTGDTTIDISYSAFHRDYPSGGGILLVENEIIRYSTYDASQQRFTGCTRGAEGSTAATHSAAVPVYWIQHEIYILYGNSSASAPSVDDNYKPAFKLSSSTNTSWDYDDFYEDDGLRSASWIKGNLGIGSPNFYGGNQGSIADPYAELGIAMSAAGQEARWYLNNPVIMTVANFQNGEKNAVTALALWSANFYLEHSADGSSWTILYYIPAPSALDTWEAWSQSISGFTSHFVALHAKNLSSNLRYVECADVTITLSSSYTPAITIGAEQGNYELSALITNTTTGEAIQIDFNIALNEDLEIDTDPDNKEITYLLDGSKQIGALSLVGGARKHWLRLQPGNNTIQFDDVGTNGLTIVTDWEERHYQ